ncbi:MAG: hypothetical protein RL215_1721, partial [Planctomycetota bacterium]
MVASSETMTSEPFTDLFERVSLLLGDRPSSRPTTTAVPAVVPRPPGSLREAGVSPAIVE